MMEHLAGCLTQREVQQGSTAFAYSIQRDSPLPAGKGCLEMILSPTSIDMLFGEEENDAPFPDNLVDLSGTWDKGMRSPPHCFMPQGVDETPPIPEIMLGVDLPIHGTLLPLRDVSMAEMPPNVTVTLKRKRSKEHTSFGHLTKVMGTMSGSDMAPLHASAADGREAETGLAPGPRMHLGVTLQQHLRHTTAAKLPAQPPPKRQRSVLQQHKRFLQKQPTPGPAVRPRDAVRPAAAVAAAAAPAAAAPERRSLQPLQEGTPRGRPGTVKEEPLEPQRKLRRRGRMPERLATILENERSSPSSEDSGEEGDYSKSNPGASPSAVTRCKLSKAACRAQGALHQLTREEVMEAEAELSPDATEEEREAAYRRVKNRSAARKTRMKKAETVRTLQEQVQVMGKHNRDLISRLKKLLVQVELYSRENAQLKGLLQYLQSQPEATRSTPS